MKIVKIQGGLGNQLFGLAFAHSIATLGSCHVALDVGGYPRDRYGHRFLLADLASSLDMGISAHPLLGSRMLARAGRRLPLPGYIAEAAPPADEQALDRIVRRGAYFNGYWQDERWMARPEETRAAVRAFLDRRAEPAPKRHEVLIHYRTYKDEIHPARRGEPGAAFVRRALEAIEARGGPLSDIALISDDPALAMLRLGDLAARVTPAATGDADADMALMLNARALVLGNSSFSWWGGFCGDAETVTYPTRGDLYHYPIPASRFICL